MVRRAGVGIEVIETIYRLEGDEHAWLQRIAEVLEPAMSNGMGVHAFTYDLTGARVNLHTSVEHRPAFASSSVIDVVGWSEAPMTSGVSYDDMWRRCCFSSCARATPFERHPAARAHGMRELLALNAIDASGHGVFVGAPLTQVCDVPAGEARLWMRVTAHLTAALRLRGRHGAAPVAVLSPNGRIEHVDDPARLGPHREARRAAVVRIERARGASRRDGDQLWRPLVKGRYTLVDRFEANGRRYVVAYDTRPTAALDALTEREREIVAAIADGQSSKHVAFSLGVSDATVRVLLARAAKRLGLATRDELVAFYRARLTSSRRGPSST